MALYAAQTPTLSTNGSPSTAKAVDGNEEDLYKRILRLRDDVLEGKHPDIKLAPTAIEQLKATLISSENNLSALAANDRQSRSIQGSVTLPGLSFHSSPRDAPSSHAVTGLDPIFLEKADSLVRAEGQLKRRRIEQDLQAQAEQRKYTTREKDVNVEAASWLDVEQVLLDSWQRVFPVSGLKPAAQLGSRSSVSFDENDYYSSQVQSQWSPSASSSSGSDQATGATAFTADFEALDGRPLRAEHSKAFASPALSRKQATAGSDIQAVLGQGPAHYTEGDDGDDEDDDDEYDPPDASAFDSFRGNGEAMTSKAAVDRDESESEYEPDDVATVSRLQDVSSRVPVIHNRLTQLAAPQPNRVSALATAKGPDIELDLVNGQTGIVSKSRPRVGLPGRSRASTVSPSGNHAPAKSRRATRGGKRRKRDSELAKNVKKRRVDLDTDRSPHFYSHIKDEPVSPFGYNHDRQQQDARSARIPQYQSTGPIVISPSQSLRHVSQAPRPGVQYENYQPTSPAMGYVASPSAARSAQRDMTDMRRVASLPQAQHPVTPDQHAYALVDPYHSGFTGHTTQQGVPQPVGPMQYASNSRAQSPLRAQQYERSRSPSLMPSLQRRIVVDQFGNRYYAAGPAPTPAPAPAPAPSRASAVPMGYERAPSRATAPHNYPTLHDSHDNRMPPPPLPMKYGVPAGHEASYRFETLSDRRVEPARDQTPPVYAPPRSYSVHPRASSASLPTYVRQTSVAPMSYAHPEAPSHSARAVNTMSSAEFIGHEVHPHQGGGYSYAPAVPAIRYVDQFGNEVFPQQIGQVNEHGYQR